MVRNLGCSVEYSDVPLMMKFTVLPALKFIDADDLRVEGNRPPKMSSKTVERSHSWVPVFMFSEVSRPEPMAVDVPSTVSAPPSSAFSSPASKIRVPALTVSVLVSSPGVFMTIVPSPTLIMGASDVKVTLQSLSLVPMV